MTCLLLIATALCASPAAAGTQQGARTYRTVVGGEYDYPPYSYSDAKGNPSGFNAELTRAIAGAMGLDIEIKVGPWTEIRKALENGKIDAIQGMFYSEERATTFDFSPPFVIINHVVFGRRGSTPVRSTQELRGKEIIVMRDDIMHDYAIKNGLSGRLLLASTPDDVLRLLASGKGDYALLAEVPGLYWIKELKLSNLTICGPAIVPSKYCYAVRKGDVILLSRFTEGLNILQQTGEYRRLYEKWLGVLEPSISRKLALKYVAAALVAMGMLLAVTLLWSGMLHKEVDRKTKDLQKSEARYRTLVENLPQKIMLKDRNSVYVSVNEAYARDLGIKPKTVAGKTDLDFFPKDLAEKYRADDARVMETGITEDLEEEYVKGGQRRFIHTVKTPVRDSQGNVTHILVILWDITEKKIAEEQLRKAMADLEGSHRNLEKSEAALKEGQRVAKIGHWEWSLLTGATTWSDEIYRIVGIPIGSVPPSSEFFFGLIDPPDRRRLEDGMARAIGSAGQAGSGGEVDIDLRVTTPAGAVLVVSERVFADRDVAGNVVGFHGTCQDITERKRTEEALRKSEAALKEAQRVAKIGHWETSLVTGVTTWSDEHYRILGIPIGSVTPSHELLLSMMDPKDRRREEEAFAGSVASDDADFETGTDLHVTTAAGTALVVAQRVFVDRDAAGNVVGFHGTIQDITQRVATEQALGESEAALDEAQEIAHIGSWVLGLESGEGHGSPEAFRIFGIDPASVIPLQLILDRVHEDDRATVAGALATAVHSGKLDVEARLATPRGTRVVRALARRRNGDEERLSLIGTIQDVTEQRAAEEVLQQRTESLERHSAELERFNRLAVGRELRMIELKQQINDLCAQLGQPARHVLPEVITGAGETS